MGNICLVGVHAGCQKGLRAKKHRRAVGIGVNPIADGLATYSHPSHHHGAMQGVPLVSSRRVAPAETLSKPALSLWFRPEGQPEERGGVILDLRSPAHLVRPAKSWEAALGAAGAHAGAGALAVPV